MSVKLAAKLPKDNNANGLDAGEAQFLANPMGQQVVIAYIETSKITTNYDEAGREATVKLAAVEIVGDQFTVPAEVRAAFEAAHDRRVNAAPTLPTEPEEDAAPEVLALTDGVDLEASLRQVEDIIDAEVLDETPCAKCGHPAADHDLDDDTCWYITADSTPCPCHPFTPKAA
jgi:hypothetical protein